MGNFTSSQPVHNPVFSSAGPTLATGDRYVTLDGLRGIAAIAVALFHLDATLMPGGYLAVDFFFALSGFVLTRSYEPRFRAGLGIMRFMQIRVIRLYPLFVLGIGIGAAFALQGLLRGANYHIPLPEFISGLIFNTLMLPSPFSRALFPFNGPAWSLFFEVLASLALVAILTKLRTVALAVLGCITGLALIAAVLHLQQSSGGAQLLGDAEVATSAGAFWDGWYVGLLRTAFSFTTGVVIARLSIVRDRPARKSVALGFAVLLLLMAVTVPLEKRIAFDLICILAFSPVLVFAGSRAEPHRWLVPSATRAGDLSYALYAIHLPIAHAFQLAARKAELSNFAVAPFYLAVSLTLAWLCVRWVDVPLRQILGRRLARPKTANPATGSPSPLGL